MTLLRSQTNSVNVVIARPTEYEPGGKRLYRVIHGNVRASLVEGGVLTEDQGSRDDRSFNSIIMRVQFRDFRGRIIDIMQGDMVTYVDYRGQDKQVIVRTAQAVYNAVGSKVDHVRIEATG